jgi:hypothetical protein
MKNNICEIERAEFAHAGDLGDIIWGMAAIQLWLERTGRKKATLHLYEQPNTTHRMTEARANLLLPLLSVQPWLHADWSPVALRSDLNNFRTHFRAWASIAGAHCGALGMKDGAHTAAVERRWLEVPAPGNGRAARLVPEVVFVRTERYRSPEFPWTDIIRWFGSTACFLGLPSEHESFVRDYREAERVPFIATPDLLEAARIIKGAKLFVGNQTALFAIAEALKIPRVLESFTPMRNCEYGSRNCLAVHQGTKITEQRILELFDAPFTI